MSQHRDREDRFAVPKACLRQSVNGAPTYGLSEKPSVRIHKHAFEAEKTEANDRSQGRMLVYPKEDHFQRVYNVYIESSSSSAMTPEEMAEEALAGKGTPMLSRREHDTSTDNPFCIDDDEAEALPADATAQVAASKGYGKLTYQRDGSTIALAGNLDSTLVPRPPSRSSSAGGASEASSSGATASAAAELEEQRRWVAERDALAVKLMREYPHGVPKRMLLQLRAEGLSHLPTLGYGGG